jgi:hypothetical protein
MRMFVGRAAVAALGGLFAIGPAPVGAQATATSPDFTGVYYPTQPPAGGAGRGGRAGGPPDAGRQGAPPPPTRSAPVEDGSAGRAPGAPKLTPAYMAKWEAIRKSRISGSSEFDPRVRCIPAGMPSMMNMFYGMEIMHVHDKITIYGEMNDMYRRIFLDGRKPSQKVLNDPTYAGYSTGHWEGDTLVVDTVALRDDSLIEDFVAFSSHSDKMTVHERIRLIEPGVLEDRITVTDPEALLEPYQMVRTFRRASLPNDELREFACAEGLARVK